MKLKTTLFIATTLLLFNAHTHAASKKKCNRALQTRLAAQLAHAPLPLIQTQNRPQRIFWVDLETTGLDHHHSHILEVAVLVTDQNLNVLEIYQRVVFQPPRVLNSIVPKVLEMHTKNGLLAEVPQGVPLNTVEQELTALIERHFPGSEKILVAGNSVSFDRGFLRFHMPDVTKRFDHRILDVSSLRIAVQMLFGVLADKPYGHRALDDIRLSIQEFQTYSQLFFPKKAIPRL